MSFNPLPVEKEQLKDTPESFTSSPGEFVSSPNSIPGFVSTHTDISNAIQVSTPTSTPTSWAPISRNTSQENRDYYLTNVYHLPKSFSSPEYMRSNGTLEENGKYSVSNAEFERSSSVDSPIGLPNIDLLALPADIPDSMDLRSKKPISKANIIEKRPQFNPTCGKEPIDTNIRPQATALAGPTSLLAKSPLCLDDHGSRLKTPQSTSLESPNLPILISQTHPNGHPPKQLDQTTSSQPQMTDSVRPNMEAKLSAARIFQEAEEIFFKLKPSLIKVNSNNFCAFLVDFVKTCHNDIPLHTLFHLLFQSNVLDQEPVLTAELARTEDYEPADAKLIAIQVCRFILGKLQMSSQIVNHEAGSAPISVPSSINFHELARSFLAIKIIFSTVRKVHGVCSSNFTTPRLSVYKVYYIICQTLIQRSANMSSCTSQSLILGQSTFGKLTNLVFPNSCTKRLGKRGQSKYHYIGFTWDSSMVGEDILKLLELDIPQLRDHFQKSGRASNHSRDSNTHEELSRPKKKEMPNSVHEISTGAPLPAWNKPLHTYVDLSHTFPDSDCSPRVWETMPNTVPPRSTWAQDHLQRSLSALRSYSIDLGSLVQNFDAGNFYEDDNNSLSNSVLESMVILQRASASTEAYLHLYFTILAMVFPVVLASNTEVYPSSKTQFRNSMKKCVSTLQSERANLPHIHETNLNTFLGILSKMINVNEMASCIIKLPYTEKILNEMTVQLEMALTAQPSEFPDRSPLETLYIRSIITSMNSYNFKFAGDSSTSNANDDIDSIASLARIFKTTALKSKSEMSMIPQDARSEGLKHVAQDVPYQVFKIALKNFHEVTLRNQVILKLPMAVFICIIHNFTNWVQCTSLNDFQKGDTEFAKECFKCCWVFSSIHHEYMRLISEVVALDETLSRNSEGQ